MAPSRKVEEMLDEPWFDDIDEDPDEEEAEYIQPSPQRVQRIEENPLSLPILDPPAMSQEPSNIGLSSQGRMSNSNSVDNLPVWERKYENNF